jgi:hypothetical protein
MNQLKKEAMRIEQAKKAEKRRVSNDYIFSYYF